MKLLRFIPGLLILTSILSATEITHTSPNFKFELPAGFEARDIPEVKTQNKILLVFTKGKTSEPDFLQLLFMTTGKEASVIDREAFNRNNNQNARLTDWKGHQIIAQSEERDGMLINTAIVPIKGSSVSLTVIAAKANHIEALKVFNQVLPTMDGPSNWKTGREIAAKRLELIESIIKDLAILGVIIYVIYKAVRKKKEKANELASSVSAVATNQTPITPPTAASASSAETPGRNDSGT